MSNDRIDDIFEEAFKGSNIFRNKNVLFHDYIPERLPFRESQINRVAKIFSSLIRREKGSNVFIYGKPGTGKTAVIKYVLNKFTDFVREKGINIHTSYVNCRIAGTEYRVLTSIAQDIGLHLPFTGLSVEEALSRVIFKIKNDNIPFLIIFDEIDVLISRYGDKILYSLTRSGYESLSVPYVIVGISNNLRFKEYLDPRVLSSLGEEEIVFKPYTASELEVILRERASIAFYKDAIDLAAIKLAAALSAAEHGDARKALDMLRVAGEIAEEKGASKVSEDHVREAYSRIDVERTYEVVRSLPLHSKLIILSLIKVGGGPIQASKLFGVYKSICESIGEKPLSYRRFHGLITELSLLGIANRRIYNYGRRGGRISSIRIDGSINEILNIIRDDPLLEDIAF